MVRVSKKPKKLGVCKHCYCEVGRDSSGVLVHSYNLQITCNGKPQAPKAELSKK